MYLIEGVLSGETFFRRNTPVRQGIESLVNEALSALIAAGASPKDYVQVSLRHPEPEVILVVLVSDGYMEVLDEEDWGHEGIRPSDISDRQRSAQPTGLNPLTDELGIKTEN